MLYRYFPLNFVSLLNYGMDEFTLELVQLAMLSMIIWVRERVPMIVTHADELGNAPITGECHGEVTQPR